MTAAPQGRAFRAARLARLGWIAARGWTVIAAGFALVTVADGNPQGTLTVLALALAPWALAWVWRGRLMS